MHVLAELFYNIRIKYETTKFLATELYNFLCSSLVLYLFAPNIFPNILKKLRSFLVQNT